VALFVIFTLMITKLFIGGLTQQTDEMALAQLVGPYGDIVTVKLVRDKMSRKSKGYGFVEMISHEAANMAIDALDGKMVNGQELLVSIRQEEPVKPVPVYNKVSRPAGNPKPKRPRINRQ